MMKYLLAATVVAALALPNLAYAQHHHGGGGGGGGWHGGGGGWHHGGGGWHGGGWGVPSAGIYAYPYSYGYTAPAYVEPSYAPARCWYPELGGYYACQ
jgi:hypothetical protein